MARQNVKYYSLADLKYDLKSGCVLPVVAEAAEIIEGVGDTDDETETDEEYLSGNYNGTFPHKTSEELTVTQPDRCLPRLTTALDIAFRTRVENTTSVMLLS